MLKFIAAALVAFGVTLGFSGAVSADESPLEEGQVGGIANHNACEVRQGFEFLNQIRSMPVPDGVDPGDWFTMQNRVQTMLGFAKYLPDISVFSQDADVCNEWEFHTSVEFNIILLEHFLSKDDFFTPTSYQCETGDFLFYWNNGGLDQGSPSLFSVWSNGCTWTSDSYANPIEEVEADLKMEFSEIYEQQTGNDWTADHDALLLKRYFDPTVVPCSGSLNTVYQACPFMEPFGVLD